jgi:hypothetical protein
VISTNFEVINEFNPALLRAFSESRLRPDIARAVNEVMKFWVSFAMNKMYPAQKAAIKSRLEAQATKAKYQVAQMRVTKTGRESKGKRYQMLKNSVAAYIVWSTNWKYKGQSVRTMTPDQFYAAVGRYIGARQFSVGYLRSGMRPALNTFRARLGQPARDVKYRRGEVGTAKRADLNERIPTAEVENFAGGIIEKFPRAFLDALPEVEAEVQKWITRNLAERARGQGLNVTTTA